MMRQNDTYTSNETLAYRLGKLEERFDQLDAKIDKVLELFATSKRAGKWIIGIAVALGGIVAWVLEVRSKIWIGR